jgi:hypothetical protein
MASPAEIVDTLEVVASVHGWSSYRLHGQRSDPARAAAPDLLLVRDDIALVVKVQSEANARKNGLTDKQAPQLSAIEAVGAEVMWVTTAPFSEVHDLDTGRTSVGLAAAIDRVERPRGTE